MTDKLTSNYLKKMTYKQHYVSHREQLIKNPMSFNAVQPYRDGKQ
jgi:hypothetical protein